MDTAWFVSVFDRKSEKLVVEMRLPDLDDETARRAIGLPETEPLHGGFELSSQQVDQLPGIRGIEVNAAGAV